MDYSKRKMVPQDSLWVNVNEEYEVPGWCKRFDCTREQLVWAVQKVGASARDVEDALWRVKHDAAIQAFHRLQQATKSSGRRQAG